MLHGRLHLEMTCGSSEELELPDLSFVGTLHGDGLGPTALSGPSERWWPAEGENHV